MDNEREAKMLDRRGFTLIELLVAISIVAILAVIGLVAYNTVFGRARDARRIQEIDAVQKAMEKKYSPVSGYLVLAGTDFASVTIPLDPNTGIAKCGGGVLMCKYCATISGADTFTGVLNLAAAGTTDYCGNANFGVLGAVNPMAGKFYTVCATLETPIGNIRAAGTTDVSYLYCKSNLQ